MKRHNSLKRNYFAVGLLAVLILIAWPASAQSSATAPLPRPDRFVNDYAGVLDAKTREELEAKVQDLKKASDIEFAIVIVKTTEGRDIFDYSLALARGWGIGSKDGEHNGLLLCIAIQDRKYFIQVSRHLEGDLTDGLTGEINRATLVPAFKQGNYAKGIGDAVDTYIATLAQKRGFSVSGVNVSQTRPVSQPRHAESSSSSWLWLIPTILIGVGFAFVIFKSSRRSKKTHYPNDGIISILDTSPRSDSNYWSSSPSDGGSSDSGSSFGGGGDFGGGGSGGSW
jgi:uncharacterized protein